MNAFYNDKVYVQAYSYTESIIDFFKKNVNLALRNDFYF